MAPLSASVDHDAAGPDLGPLAWVLDELRKSLDGASKALRRFVRDAELALGSDLSSLDASPLRIARQQLHQAVGALEMVGQGAPAKLLHAMEALAQKFVQQPQTCSEEAAATVERAGFALIEFLEGVLKGKNASPVALFAQYRAVFDIVGTDRAHPADLWPQEWRWQELAPSAGVAPLPYSARTRETLDQSVLQLMRTGDRRAAQHLAAVCDGLAAAQQSQQPGCFWQLGAAYFEAVGLGLCPDDVYSKRLASRVLRQYTSLAAGSTAPSEGLCRELLFYCDLAKAPEGAPAAPRLQAVRTAFGLADTAPVDYQRVQFGRYDPALMQQARKRIALASETWSALAGGDTTRLSQVVDQFAAVSDSVLKLHPENSELAAALGQAVELTARSGQAPKPTLAMEVATAILYLEAAYDDWDPTDSQMGQRSASLARRLGQAMAGEPTQVLEVWMEELYRRVSERQTMGSVVEELRTTLALVEQSLDQFFRQPQSKGPLHEVPSRLAQMRGVFSVLGLDQASLAALRMRAMVEQLLVDPFDAASPPTPTFERLGNSLGTLGFLVDMLGYQRALAKKLFVYDEERGEFRPVMGRTAQVLPAQEVDLPSSPALPDAPQLAPQAPETPAGKMPAPVPAPVPVATAQAEDLDDEQELRSIFLDEAREVVRAGQAAVQDLWQQPGDAGQLTSLRRAFHTLKGSSRMVGLSELGEAAWAFEQLLNTWLADLQAASDALLTLTDSALQAFARWVEDIAGDNDAAWSAHSFRRSADALRLERQLVPLQLPDDLAAEVAPTAQAAKQEEPGPAPAFDFELPDATPAEPAVEAASPPLELAVETAASAHEAPPSDALDADLAIDLEALLVAASMPAVADATDLAPETTPDPLQAEPALAVEPAPAAVEQASVSDTGEEPFVDEETKVIGPLHLSIPLYNVYLNEADEWSRRLQMELGEWALEWHAPLPDSVVALAHSLLGSSATVGFTALAELARLMEQALQHVQLLGQGQPEFARTFCDGAEDVRRLLHQFAAGFLKEADASVLQALQALCATPLPAHQTAALATELDDWFSDAPPEAQPADLETPEVQDAEPEDAALLAVAAPPEVQDSLDKDLFPIFEEEATELLPQLAAALRQWVAHADKLGARGEALRALHTLKGSARLAGAMVLGDMAHRLESDIEAIGLEDVREQPLEFLLARYDALQDCFSALRAKVQVPLAVETAPPVPQPARTRVLPPVDATPEVPQAAAQGRAGAAATVRVRAQLLDRLVNQAGEVMMSRVRMDARLNQLRGSLDELTGNLDRLRRQLRDLELQSESQMQSRLALSKETAQGFDPLEFDRFTRVQELSRMMAESVHDVATVQRNILRSVEGAEDDLVAQTRQARELQRDLLRSRMVEFDSIAERLHGVVRQAAKECGKQARLEIEGASIEVDRGVLERMAPAFEHLLRNAVVHGIEDADVRAAAAKPEGGCIRIAVQQAGNDIAVTFADDGAGLDLGRIRTKAQAAGLVSAQRPMSDQDLAQLIFEPGFSTAAQVTELAGRGIGMDVVRSEVNALGGRIETVSTAGEGCRFTVVLPLTTAVTQVVMLRMGDFTFGVPSNLVEKVLRLPAAALDVAYAEHSFVLDAQPMPFFWGGALLQLSGGSEETQGKTRSVVVLRSAGQQLALHVDEVLGNREVVVKNLGPQLASLPGLTGVSVLASGAVALIYNPVALLAVYGDAVRRRVFSPPRAVAEAAPAGEGGGAPLVLVVDDSITVRRVTQRLLRREGYRVELASDGLQALEKLQGEKPAVVLSDIEMPHMDGFDLVRNIRADARLHDVPVIMITSRIAEKHREHAKALGINHYLGKPYSEDELIKLVQGNCLAQ